MQSKTLFRTAAGLTGLALSLALAAAPAQARKAERGVEPVHQPVVERTDPVLDVAGSGSGELDKSNELAASPLSAGCALLGAMATMSPLQASIPTASSACATR